MNRSQSKRKIMPRQYHFIVYLLLVVINNLLVVQASSRYARNIAATASLPSKSSSAWLDGVKSGMSSAMAAACVKTTLQPIDAIKTVQQYSTKSLSIWEACSEIMSRKGGFLNFYAGLGGKEFYQLLWYLLSCFLCYAHLALFLWINGMINSYRLWCVTRRGPLLWCLFVR